MFESLVEQGLVTEKKYPNGLRVFKYTRKVFYDALWETDAMLLEARGMVLAADDEKVIWPFTKVFNHGENGTTCEKNRIVQVIEKINGFMGAARIWKGELIVSTTGTLDSDYATLARSYIEELNTANMLAEYTYIFEICSPDDPHIVAELEGAYLIGMRNMETGELVDEARLDYEADMLNAPRAEWEECLFGVACDRLKDYRGEGFMIRDAETNEVLMKMKSPHYLIKKFLMRMGKNKMDTMFNDRPEFLKYIDEEFYGIVHYITERWDLGAWKAIDEQARRRVIEDYFLDVN